MKIVLDGYLEQYVSREIASGRYSTPVDVVSEAFMALAAQDMEQKILKSENEMDL
jgi:Arc/MetJ-type ribon-helix-helix transcriptional regulator